ncbi:MAG: hypothetical protein AABY86_02280, partial [Bdellovibrionota bacterium]
MKTSLVTFFTLLVAMMSTTAFGKSIFDRQIDASVYHVQTELAVTVENKLNKLLGEDGFWISVKVSIDKQQLKKDFSTTDSDTDQTESEGEKLLPGIAISDYLFKTNIGENQTVEKKQVFKELVLSYVTLIEVEIRTDNNLTGEESTLLEHMITDHLRALSVPIRTKFVHTSIPSFRLKLDQSKDKEKIQNGQRAEDKKQSMDITIIAIVCVGVLGILLMILVGLKFGRSVMQVGAGLKRALEMLANTTGDSAILQRTSMDFKNFGPRKDSSSMIAGGTNFSDTPAQMTIKKVRALVEDFSEISMNYLEILLNERQFEKMLVLVDIIGVNKCYEHIKKSNPDLTKGFSEFLSRSANDFLNDHQKFL